MTDAYAESGVDTAAADRGVTALVDVLRTIDLGRPSRTVPLPGHFAAVIEVAPGLGIALGTDGVGSKLIVAEQAGRYDTVGHRLHRHERQRRRLRRRPADSRCSTTWPSSASTPTVMAQIGTGLKRGAELAGVEIPGGEVAVLPELIRGHPSPNGFDLTAACVGTVRLDAIVSGAECRPGDALIGIPSSGLHSNGYSLARRALSGLELDDRPAALGGASVADALLEPTVIYVKAVLELLASGLRVHGLAHITGGGLLNLTRLHDGIGFEVTDPLPVPPVFGLVRELGGVTDAEMWEVFNMGCGFCAVVPESTASAAAALLAAHHPGARRIGTVTDRAGRVEVPVRRRGPIGPRSRGRAGRAPRPRRSPSARPPHLGRSTSAFFCSQSSRASPISSSSRSDCSCMSSSSRSGASSRSHLPVSSPIAHARRASRAGRRLARRGARACAPRAQIGVVRLLALGALALRLLELHLLGLVGHAADGYAPQVSRGGRSRWRAAAIGPVRALGDRVGRVALDRVWIVPSAPTDSTMPMCSSQTIRSPGCGVPAPAGIALPARWAQA